MSKRETALWGCVVLVGLLLLVQWARTDLAWWMTPAPADSLDVSRAAVRDTVYVYITAPADPDTLGPDPDAQMQWE